MCLKDYIGPKNHNHGEIFVENIFSGNNLTIYAKKFSELRSPLNGVYAIRLTFDIWKCLNNDERIFLNL